MLYHVRVPLFFYPLISRLSAEHNSICQFHLSTRQLLVNPPPFPHLHLGHRGPLLGHRACVCQIIVQCISAHLGHRTWRERHHSLSAAPVASNAIDLSTIAGSLAATGVTEANISPFAASIASVEPSSMDVSAIFGLLAVLGISREIFSPLSLAVALDAAGSEMKGSAKYAIQVLSSVDGHLSNIRSWWSPITDCDGCGIAARITKIVGA